MWLSRSHTAQHRETKALSRSFLARGGGCRRAPRMGKWAEAETTGQSRSDNLRALRCTVLATACSRERRGAQGAPRAREEAGVPELAGTRAHEGGGRGGWSRRIRVATAAFDGDGAEEAGGGCGGAVPGVAAQNRGRWRRGFGEAPELLRRAEELEVLGCHGLSNSLVDGEGGAQPGWLGSPAATRHGGRSLGMSRGSSPCLSPAGARALVGGLGGIQRRVLVREVRWWLKSRRGWIWADPEGN